MAADYREVEARWIKLDRDMIEKKLGDIGADKMGEYFFKEWIFRREGWKNAFRRIRVRTDGEKHWVTYKANPTWGIDSTEEIEVEVSSSENAVALLRAADIPLLRYQEKKRNRYFLNDITFDLDFWPKIPMVLEIEAMSKEKVEEGARLLGLNFEEAIYEDQKVVHEKYFNIDLDAISEYRFES